MGIADFYYRIADWLEGKGIPPKAFFAAVAIVIIAVVLLLVLPLISPQASELVVIVKDERAQLIPGQEIRLVFEDKSSETITTNANGKASSSKARLGEKVKVLIDRQGFDSISETVILDKAKVEKTFVLKRPIVLAPTRINLFVADSTGASLEGKEVTITLSCPLNPSVQLSPGIIKTTNASAVIEVPKECPLVYADVSAQGFSTKTGLRLSQSELTITLEEVQVPKGKVIVRILNESNEPAREAFSVSLYAGDTEIASRESADGIAEFESVEKQEYYAIVTDSAGRFESARTNTARLSGEQITLKATVKRQTKGTLSLKVLDAASNARVENAKVKLLDSSGSVAASVITDSNSDKNIALFDYGTFTIQVLHDDYLAFEEKAEFKTQTASFTARLEKCVETAANCGKLEALVIDEDNLAVENAEVSVYNSETQLLAPVLPKTTDVNGVAKFANLKKGRYFLRAVKYPAEKKDSGNAFELDPKALKKQTIRMEIGTGIVKVIVKDEENQPIPNALVEFRTDSGKECPKANGEACSLETDAVEGKAEYAFKADKKVYAIISKEGFSSFTTSSRQVLKAQTLTLEAGLRKTIPGDKPDIRIVGFFGLDGTTRKNELKAGQRYIARIKLDIPEGLEPEKAGFFIMAGRKEKGSLLENDLLYFRNLQAPETIAVKGTSWNPTDGMDLDLNPDNLTNSDFKWAEVSIKNPKANATYFIDAEVKVRENVTAGQELLLHYRAWVENSSGEIIRSPFDSRLGTALETESVQSLYALPETQPYYEGKHALCEDESGFCYYNERVYDESEGLNIQEPYDLKVFQAYTFTFEISNISKKVYGANNNARFQLKNSDNSGATLSDVLQILDYEFTNANNSPASQEGLNAFEIPEQQVLELSENKTLKVRLRFQPKKAESSTFYIRIIADSETVFEREVMFSVNAEDELSLSLEPDFLGAFIRNDFNAIVVNQENIEQENATVRVTRISPDRIETVIGEKKTSRLGSASFSIPSSSPGTSIRIEAEKEGFEGAILERKIDENILVFDPEELEARLDLKGRKSQELLTTAENKVPISLVISNARITGNFGGYLDEDLMNNFLAQFIGNLSFAPNDSKVITVKAAISPSALLEKEVKVSGFVHLEATSPELGKKWAFNIPLKAEIGLGGNVDETGCLGISLKEWKTLTQENLTSKEFYIANNCAVEGNDIEVKFLKARLKWISNPIGNVQINVVDPETGSSASEILRDNDWITLFDTLRPVEEREYYAIISFAPSSGHLNEEAKFKVEFDAVTLTDSGAKSVGASNPINAEILVTTLSQCVEFEPGSDTGIRIGRDEEEKTFSVSTANCKNVPVQLRFCQDSAGNANCKGGTSLGGIEVSPWTTSSLKEASKEITVRRQSVDGLYGITVEAKVPGRSWQKIATYDVIVEPKDGKYFTLDKYGFIMLGKDAKDSTVLFNEMLQESVTVNTTDCDYSEAASSSDFVGAALAGTIGTLLTSKVTIATTAKGFLGLGGGTTTETGHVLSMSFKTGSTLGDPNVATESLSSLGSNGKGMFGGMPIVGIIIGAALGYATGGFEGAVVGAASAVVAWAAYVACGDGIWGLACSLVAGMMTSFLGSFLGGGEPECTDIQVDLADYVINLKGVDNNSGVVIASDAQPLALEKYQQEISPEWNLEVSDVYLDSSSTSGDIQEAGIVFTNNGIEKEEPLYDILTVRATEHIHGDATHEDAEVTCDDSDYGNLNIKCEETTQTYAQRFHVRFKTKETRQQLPKIQFDTLDCSTSTLMGRTGEGALPKVKLDWSWITGKGIDYDSCDADNPKGVYCDATQFSIAFTKRMHFFDEFLRKNSYFENVCPETISSLAESGLQASMVDGNADVTAGGRILDTNQAYIKSVFREALSTSQSNIAVTISNNTGQNAIVNLSLAVNFTNGTFGGTCSLQNISISPFSQAVKECPMNLAAGGYVGEASLSAAAGNNAGIDANVFRNAFFILETNPDVEALIEALGCDIERTTDIATGKPVIEKFVEAAGNVSWTQAIPDLNALRKLLHYDALLMKDAFSMDFRKDFVNYYETQSLADASQFFKDNTTGFKKYLLDDNQLQFTNKYFDSEKIWASGRYRIDVGAYFADDWRLFDGNGNAKAAVGVSFYLIKEPSPSSPFYSMPLNGQIGLEGDSYNRQGYGSSFQNQDDIVLIDNSPTPARTSPDAGSNAIAAVKTRVESNLKNLNNDLTRRGNLLSLETKASSEKDLEFSRNLATPVVMKITASEKTSEKFSAFYNALQGGTPAVVGSSLALWSVGGNCYDFSGLPLIQVFDEKPDRKATALDNINNWETAYAVDWENVEKTGDNFLRTIFYTPSTQQHYLQAVQPSGSLSFISPDSEGSSIALNGISTMQKNSLSSNVASVEDIFQLVRDSKVCVTNTGVRTRFWWNPKAVFGQAGSQRSISGFSNGLEAGKTCIG
ncbi:MAG: carboxypeptidase regulatory-like domain-containing protein [Candidatus Diapherotrites archaeon]|uniref:Carboxypeptidase regulatory-like domain-containing protein n=1 Tax=Candidatus Iainarchaeum sp. TaxID=3101447 RepID=A0A7J4K123_9ARCH|nr:MAG: hypothetical protein QT12_C0005G0005 [archaeon GW2011_AR21]MBS3058218.1 carboxypeptidase regulatory-like domain-containing protein [Candidatus Diapherotrites archaeon]HIH21847.1 carboxypeptidase regulatory-like domain-containing protein [Candidatus Diapherotrites archaeon]